MPNRILKESVTTSCEIDSLTAEEERFFYRLIVVCDDYGRVEAHPSILRAKCFPLKIDQVKDKDINKWLQSLIDVGLIMVYEVNSKQYLQMMTWQKHQQRRAKHSKYPSPEIGTEWDDINCNQLQSNVPEESRNRGIEKRECEDLFEHLWKLYPRKKGKGNVSDTQKKRLYDIGKEHMERCIHRFKNDMEKEGRPIDKYPYGSTFFNSGYIDYLDENYEPQHKDKNPSPSEELIR